MQTPFRIAGCRELHEIAKKLHPRTVGGVYELYQRRYVIATLCRPQPNFNWGRVGAAGNRFARDDKELGPQLGKQLPRERPRETAET